MKIVYVLFLVLILSGYFLYIKPGISVEDAFWGLTAKHIVTERHFPIWREGGKTIGALPAYFIYPIVFLLGMNRLSLYITYFIFYLFLIFSTYFLGEGLSLKKGGIMAVCLTILLFPLTRFTVPADAFFLSLSNIFLLLILKICYDQNKKDSTFILLGIIGGLAFWLYFSFIPLLFMAIILFLLEDNRFLFSRRFIFFIVSFLIGSFPFWFFNLDNNFYNFKIIKQRMYIWYIPLWGLLFGVCFFFFCYKIRNSIVSIVHGYLKQTSKYTLFFLLTIFAIMFNASIDFMPLEKVPFSILLCLVVPFIGTFLILDIGLQKIRFAAFYSCLFLLFFANIFVLKQETKIEMRMNKDVGNLMGKLKQNGITYVYTYHKLVPLINFLSDEVIMAVALDDKNYSSYIIKSSSLDKVAIVIPREQGIYPINQLYFSGLCFRRKYFDSFVLLYNIKSFEMEGKKISPEKWNVIANLNNKETGWAFDQDMNTRWTTNVTQRPGMYYLLDLGEEEIVYRIILYLGQDVYDSPAGVKIKISTDKKKWHEVVRIHNNKEILFWNGRQIGLVKNVFDKQEFIFLPVRARFIKIIQTGCDFNYYWSVRELEIYSSLCI